MPFSRPLRALLTENVEPCVVGQGRCVKNVEPSALATRGLIFSARDSCPRQRVRNSGSAWRTTNKAKKYRAKKIDFQERLSNQKINFSVAAPHGPEGPMGPIARGARSADSARCARRRTARCARGGRNTERKKYGNDVIRFDIVSCFPGSLGPSPSRFLL